MYEEKKLRGSICRVLAEKTCLFPNLVLYKPFKEGIKCRYRANSSQYLVVSFGESIVRVSVAYSVLQKQVCSIVCFIKIVRRGKKSACFHKEGEEEKLVKNEKVSSNPWEFNL